MLVLSKCFLSDPGLSVLPINSENFLKVVLLLFNLLQTTLKHSQ